MIVRNGSSELTEVHFDGKSEKQVFVGNHLVWPAIDWDKYSFRVTAFPNSSTFDYTASRNIDGITSMAIQDSYFEDPDFLEDFTEIEPSTKISVADMKFINYKAKYGRPLYIYYTGNYISANMFDESTNDTSFGSNDIIIYGLKIYKNLDYIGDNAFKNDGEDNVYGHNITNILFGQNVTKIPSLSSTALPNNFLTEGEISVPKSLEEAFKNADVWKNYADIIRGY